MNVCFLIAMEGKEQKLPTCVQNAEFQKRANRANQLVLFFLAGANFWEKHAKNRRKHAKTGENTRKTGAFMVLILLGEKLVGANFYAFCNYGCAIFLWYLLPSRSPHVM